MFFTKIAKVALWISIVLEVIGSVIWAVQANCWWLAPLGWVITFVSASVFGTVIEISEHTQETNDHLCRMRETSYMQNNSSAPNTHYAPRTDYAGAVSKLSAIANGDSPKEDFWYCLQCGEKNPNTSMICKGCGKYK